MGRRQEYYYHQRNSRKKMQNLRWSGGGEGYRRYRVVDEAREVEVPEPAPAGPPPASPPPGPAGPPPDAREGEPEPRPCTPAWAQTPKGRVLLPDFEASTPVTVGRGVFRFQEGEPSPVRPFRAVPRIVNETAPAPKELAGRRVVQIMSLIEQIRNESRPGAHAPIGETCSFLDSEYVGEEKMGFKSFIKFKCTKCHLVTRLDTDKCDENTLGVNQAMAFGALAGGGGFANLQEMAAAVNMHCMSQKTYIAHERKLGLGGLEQATLEKMLEAGKEELELARLAGDRSPDGKYWIRVIADGMWSKRSYGNKYDAKSGVAFIIGARTGKILFYGVRNKHCYVCTLDHNKKKPVREHTCAKNFNGPSGQMEASIIMEGFKASLEMHGVRFLQLVGDRDSTVHKTLVEEAPYGLGFTVEKIDCKNHLLRNYRTWCLQLGANTNFPIPEGVDAKDTKQKQFWIKELRILRTLIKNKTKRLSNAISKASTYRARQEGTLHVRIQQLSDDIKNSACHVFGEHSRCQAYFCQTARNRAQAGPSAPPAAPAVPAAAQSQEEAAPDEAVLNWVPRLQKSGLWTKLMSNLDTMANRANSLIENVNNNMCEVANSVVAKFIAGKRVFYSSRASFNVRCAAATLAMNTSGDFRRIVHKKLQNGKSPGKFTATHSALKAKRLMQQRERRTKVRAAGPPPRRVFDAAGHNAYGLEARAPGDRDESVDDPPAAKPQQPLPEDPRLPAKMQEVTDRLQADLRHLQEISSYPQGGHKWLGARKIRITASNFGPVVRRSKGHSCKVLVRTMLHSKKKPTPAMRHGNDMEASARRYFEQKYGRTVNQTGLVVDRQLPFLAASPDGLIGDDELLEIKCPTSGVDFSSAEEAVAGDKLKYLKFGDDHQLYLDERSDYYYQIQGQLHMTGRRKCTLFVCQFKTEKNAPPKVIWEKCLIIERDDEKWSRDMEPKLREFYYGCFLQELASPRFTMRHLVADIRELVTLPAEIEEKQREVKENRKRKLEERRQAREIKAEGRKQSTKKQKNN